MPGLSALARFAAALVWFESLWWLLRYAGVTPNLPDATCFILEFLDDLSLSDSLRPLLSLTYRPILFIASAIASWASGLIEPRLIAAVANLLNIASFGSTCAKSIGALSRRRALENLLSSLVFAGYGESQIFQTIYSIELEDYGINSWDTKLQKIR